MSAAGAVKCWGLNTDGQLGVGSDEMTLSTTPIAVPGLESGATAIAAGSRFTCVVVSGGVRCFGVIETHTPVPGQPGPASFVDVLPPGSDVVALSAGDAHACARTSGGAVWCWGSNLNGELGDGTRNGGLAPVRAFASGVIALAVGGATSCAVTGAAIATCWGQLDFGGSHQATLPTAIGGVGPSFGIAVGAAHACALSSDGVSCWGGNEHLQLGSASASGVVRVPGVGAGIAEIVAGGYHTCAIGSGGALTCWGRDRDGELGDGNARSAAPPVTIDGLRDVVAVAAGTAHTCALTRDGVLRCWGRNVYGQLGDGTNDSTASPIVVDGL